MTAHQLAVNAALRIWIVTSDAHGDGYFVVAAAVTEAEAREWAEAYNAAAAAAGLHAYGVGVDEVRVHRTGDPLPHVAELWNADTDGIGPVKVVVVPGHEPEPHVYTNSATGPFAHRFLTREDARAAFLAEADEAQWPLGGWREVNP